MILLLNVRKNKKYIIHESSQKLFEEYFLTLPINIEKINDFIIECIKKYYILFIKLLK